MTVEIRAKIAAAKAQEEEKKKLEAQGEDKKQTEEEEEEEEIDVPGSCYVKLLQFVSEDAYPGKRLNDIYDMYFLFLSTFSFC